MLAPDPIRLSPDVTSYCSVTPVHVMESEPFLDVPAMQNPSTSLVNVSAAGSTALVPVSMAVVVVRPTERQIPILQPNCPALANTTTMSAVVPLGTKAEAMQTWVFDPSA